MAQRDRPGVRQVLEGSGEQGKMEKTGCKTICGAPTTLAVKGLMMMMVRVRVVNRRDREETQREKGLCNILIVVYMIFGPCPFTRQSLAFVCLFACLVFRCRWFLCLLGFN